MAAVLAWALLWYLTPGLRHPGVGSRVAQDSASILMKTAVALILLVVIVARPNVRSSSFRLPLDRG